ncbi:MAG: Holliday junction branch migration protein RuvA [Fusobacteriaceae bacterium]|nr:Holliday junction branch migration protein RuvA [Fusobacteriaceae bacterium]MBP6322577.1 Holliday junction branch migration protein RuvA [Fusobacteriaceae bacterium]MBP9509641.1 Holliday junction branch migration protein RuvA [Fusobacteriaceae bacterium]
MFEYLKGKIEYKKPEFAAVDIGGVGYKVYISLKTYDRLEVGGVAKIYIYNFIKEDSFKLIGFLEERERVMFEMLLSVSGIGVSLALSILSSFDIEEIRKVVAEEDFKTLKRVPKLGEKKSKQVILDLKSKLGSLDIISCENLVNFKVDPSTIIMEELYLALESLGYSKKEIDSLLTKEELKSFESIEVAIKFVLKKIREKK